ncbi:hypothetical protein G7Y79_00021g049940 [Physcia stellaris]|nr:hypothetical protein G7Y79_00021g049940 [Physcia stellaris]
MFPTSPAPSENRRAQASRPQQGGNRAAFAPASAGYAQGTTYAGNSEMLAPPYTSARTSRPTYPDPALAIGTQEPYFMGSTDAAFSQQTAGRPSQVTNFGDRNGSSLGDSDPYNSSVGHPQMVRTPARLSYEQPAFGLPSGLPIQRWDLTRSDAVTPSAGVLHRSAASLSQAQPGHYQDWSIDPRVRQPSGPAGIAGESWSDDWITQTIPHDRWWGSASAMGGPPLPSSQYGYVDVAAMNEMQAQRLAQGFIGGGSASHRAPVQSDEARSAYLEGNDHGPSDNLGYDVDDDEHPVHTTASPFQAPPATQSPYSTNVALPPVNWAGDSQVQQGVQANNVARPSKRTRASKRASGSQVQHGTQANNVAPPSKKTGASKRTRKREPTRTNPHNGMFEHRKNDREDWQPAIRHSTIFQPLLQWAKSLCRYVVPPKRGAAVGDETAPVPGHEEWAEARNRRPDILFQLEPPEGGVQPAVGHAMMFTYNGLRVIDRHNKWMRLWADVPVTVSSEIEGWHIEALQRRNPDLTIPDLQARMLDSTPYATTGTSTITNRSMRFRKESFNVSWGIWRKQTRYTLDWLKALLPQRCLDENSTRCLTRDLSEEGKTALTSYLAMNAAGRMAELAKLRSASPLAVHPQAQSSVGSSAQAPVQTAGAGPLARHQRRARPLDATVSRPSNKVHAEGREDRQTNPRSTQPSNRQKRPLDDDESITRVDSRHQEHPEDEQENNASDAPRKRLRHNLSSPPVGSSPARDINPESDHLQDGDPDTGSPSSPGSPLHSDELVEDDEDAIQQDQDTMLNDPDLAGDALDASEYDQDTFEDTLSDTWEQFDARLHPGRFIADEEQDDVDLVNQIQDAPLDFWSDVDPSAQLTQDSLTTMLDEDPASLARIYLRVGLPYTIICLDDKVANKGLVRDEVPDGTVSLYPESLATLGLAPQSLKGAQADIQDLMNRSNSKAPVPRNHEHIQAEDNAEQKFRAAYLPVGKTYIIICHGDQVAHKAVTVKGDVTDWKEHTLEATLEDIGNLLAELEELGFEEYNLEISDLEWPPTPDDNEEFEEEPSRDDL